MDEASPDEVEAALRRAMDGGDDSLVAFFATLLRGHVVILARPGRKKRPAEPPIVLQFFTIDGEDHIPIYTSPAKVAATRAAHPGMIDGSPLMTIDPRGLFSMTWGRHFILNPHSDDSVDFPPGQIDRLMDAVDGTFTMMRVGSADDVPPSVVEKITRWLDQVPGVRAAHLGWRYYPSQDRKTIMVVILDDPGDLPAATLDFPPGSALEQAVQIEILAPGPGGMNLLEDVPPFYVRP